MQTASLPMSDSAYPVEAKEIIMLIGEFTRTKSGFTGHIRTITLDIEITLAPADPSESDGAPDYRVHLGSDDDGPEIGAGWKRTGERAGAYVALQLDDPAFVQPLRANLFHSGEDGVTHHLVWNRASRQNAGPARAEDRAG